MNQLSAPQSQSSFRRSSSALQFDLSRPSSLYEVFIALKEKESNEKLTDEDIESKFTSLALAFKTDKLTLSNRLDLQKRQRDLAEGNMEEELANLRSSVEAINQLAAGCVDLPLALKPEVLQKLEKLVEVLKHASDRVSSAAEVYGAVQQEARMSRAIEIMLQHVQNLKALRDKEHAELLQSRRLLSQHHLSLDNDSEGRSHANRMRSVSVIQHSSHHAQALTATAIRLPADSSEATLGSASLESPKIRRASIATHVLKNQESNSAVSRISRRVGLAGDNFRKLSSSMVSGYGSSGSGGKVFSNTLPDTNVSSGTAKAPDEPNNNQDEHNDGKEENVQVLGSECQMAKPKIRSLSLIEPVKEEEDETGSVVLMAPTELTQSSRSYSVRSQTVWTSLFNVIRWAGGLHRKVMLCYRDMTLWPWDSEDTWLWLRYLLTLLLLLAAFLSLLFTFISQPDTKATLPKTDL